MKFLITWKNKLENVYKKFPRIVSYLGKLVFSLCCFFLLRYNCGYNAFLSNIWVVIILSVFCAFVPARYLMFIIMVYTIIQIFSLSVGAGVVCATILLIIYFIYFRFDERYVYLMFLMPVFYMARLPLLIPLVLAVSFPFNSVVIVLFGTVIYYMIRYINLNAAVISGMTQESEYTKMSFVVNGIFTNEEFLYTLIIMFVVFLLAFYLKKVNMNQATNLAIFAGCGAYIILCIIANLVFETITGVRLVTIVAGSIVSALLAAAVVYVLLPLDYTRLETFEFEDDEYHYYVRAVPKAIIRKEAVRVKKINSRKETDSRKVKGNDQ